MASATVYSPPTRHHTNPLSLPPHRRNRKHHMLRRYQGQPGNANTSALQALSLHQLNVFEELHITLAGGMPCQDDCWRYITHPKKHEPWVTIETQRCCVRACMYVCIQPHCLQVLASCQPLHVPSCRGKACRLTTNSRPNKHDGEPASLSLCTHLESSPGSACICAMVQDIARCA